MNRTSLNPAATASGIACYMMALLAILTMSGCGDSADKMKYGQGIQAVIVFLGLTLSTLFLHWAHGKDWFQDLRKRMRSTVSLITPLMVLASLACVIYGLGQEGSGRLMVFIGLEGAIISYCLKKWALTDDLSKQKLYTRVSSVSFAALIVLIYILRTKVDLLPGL